MSTPESRRWWPQVLIVSLFFLWGMANNLNDVLIAHFRSALSLGDFASGLVQSAFYLGYFCFAVPAALFMRRRGYRAGVVAGLILFGLGALLFWPAAAAASYPFFLLALFVIASGLAFLETAANPLVAMLGKPEGAARRLNLAQGFNPLGSMTGIEIGRRFILADRHAATVPGADTLARVQLPYALIGAGVLLWALLVALARFPVAAADNDEHHGSVGSLDQYRALLARPRVLAGVLAQFCYVGAQVGIWSYLIRYTQIALPGTAAPQAAGYITVSLVLFTIGRFAGSLAMTRLPGAVILCSFALIDAGLCAFAANTGGHAGVWALVASSAMMSVMYPTIFVLTIEGLGELVKPASSVLVMAIIGGAGVTAVMGLVSDAWSIDAAMLVPAICFMVIAGFAWFAALHVRSASTTASERVTA